MKSTIELKHQLEQQFGAELIDCCVSCDQLTLVLSPEHLLGIARILRDDERFAFSELVDLCGVDYSAYGQVDWDTQKTTATGFNRGRTQAHLNTLKPATERFAVVYHLLSLRHNLRLRLRCFLADDPPRIHSVSTIWNSADWYEREAFDLFGILFEGHPDLRRILTDYGFIGHPFRKDFPLEGNVEVRYDPDKGRVVYQPVTISNRVLVPRVIRDDNRYVLAKEEQSDA